ncbi:MAG: hypothetical protein WCE38_10325 [Burkholderiales bacterium]
MKFATIAKSADRYAVLVAALLLAVPSAHAADASLGRLFYTPQQRAELDRKRATNAVETEVVVESLVTVNGRVIRSSGKTTTWINGVPQFDTYEGRDAAHIAIDDNGRDTTVSVGDTLDRTRGEVRPAVAPGDIEINVNPRNTPGTAR